MKFLKKHKGVVIAGTVAVVAFFAIVGILVFRSISTSVEITKKEAETIALDEFGGTIISTEVDYDDFRVSYEVTLIDDKGNEIEVTVDGDTGRIREVDYDD